MNRFKNSVGTYRWQLSRAIPQKDHNGQIQRWVGTSTDIQDQKNLSQKLEQQINERTKELSELNKYLIIKKGEHGALLFHEKNVFFAPALPLEDVFDPTGAGDTFAGGFIGHIARTKDISFENMKTAIIVGSAMASFCVEKFGTERLREISKPDIDARMKEFVQLVNFDIDLV